MKNLSTSSRMSTVFRGLVLSLVFILVACGGDSDEPTPSPEPDTNQAAVPTAPSLESTPDTVVSEDEITVLRPDVPSTPADAESGTPEATAAAAETEAENGPATEASPPATPAEAVATEDVEVSEATTEDDDEVALVDVAATPESAVRTPTGNETYDNPGDGTGGSGMPGERASLLDEDEEDVGATPSASPVAQLSVIGCEVPDVPNFTGETTTFMLMTDVNFRSGPGVDCDPLLDEPLGEGQIVIVSGGPVIQSEDDTEWVLIEIDGTPGWITTEFIEPAD